MSELVMFHGSMRPGQNITFVEQIAAVSAWKEMYPFLLSVELLGNNAIVVAIKGQMMQMKIVCIN